MEIIKNGTQASVRGPADWFSGTVRIDPLFLEANHPSRVTGASVTFEPGARTAWHSHPLGQTLIVTAGLGLVQREGGPIEEIRPGDVVRFASYAPLLGRQGHTQWRPDMIWFNNEYFSPTTSRHQNIVCRLYASMMPKTGRCF